jgi:flagellar biosynthesis/type III secretory pathway protein FliH
MKSSFEPVPLHGFADAAFVPRSRAERVLPDPEPVVVESESESSAQGDGEAAAQAQAEAIEALRAAVAGFDLAVEEAGRIANLQQRRWLNDALEFGFALARHVLERELTLDPEAFHPLVERAADLLRPGIPLEVALPSQSFALAKTHASEPLEAIRRKHEVTFREDSSLGVDEARVSGGASSVDVGIERMLALLRDELSTDWEPGAAPEVEPA